jgi:hypothetical protein
MDGLLTMTTPTRSRVVVADGLQKQFDGLSNVSFGGKRNGDIPVYNSTSGLWESRQPEDLEFVYGHSTVYTGTNGTGSAVTAITLPSGYKSESTMVFCGIRPLPLVRGVHYTETDVAAGTLTLSNKATIGYDLYPNGAYIIVMYVPLI